MAFWLVSRSLPMRPPCGSRLPPIDVIDWIDAALPRRVRSTGCRPCDESGNGYDPEGDCGDLVPSGENVGPVEAMRVVVMRATSLWCRSGHHAAGTDKVSPSNWLHRASHVVVKGESCISNSDNVYCLFSYSLRCRQASHAQVQIRSRLCGSGRGPL